jgi:hypothetical protein
MWRDLKAFAMLRIVYKDMVTRFTSSSTFMGYVMINLDMYGSSLSSLHAFAPFYC